MRTAIPHWQLASVSPLIAASPPSCRYTLPFKLVFVGNSLDPLLTALDVVCDLWLLADTFGQFALAFTIDGRLILDPKHIRQRYLRGTSEARFVRQGGRIMQGGRDHSWRALLGGAFLYAFTARRV